MLHPNDEELLTDESFINFCLDQNRADKIKWTEFIENHPSEAARLDELRTIVILTRRGIEDIELKNQIAALETKIDRSEENTVIQSAPTVKKRRLQWIMAAASLTVIAGAAVFYRTGNHAQPQTRSLSYVTQPAEKKSITLPDGSTVILNAGSKLFMEPSFGENDRKVRLEGEAFFEVTHDPSKPFKVETPQMEIKVLGTVFNVKAYKEDDLAEASLVSGSIELSLKNEHKTITLHPNEKYVLHSTPPVTTARVAAPSKTKRIAKEGILPVMIDKIDASIIEVSWTKDKLAFVDEPFGEVLKRLERWYGIRFILEDPSLADNLYTGSFRKESVEDVLSALQFSKPFQYKKQDHVITIFQ